MIYDIKYYVIFLERKRIFCQIKIIKRIIFIIENRKVHAVRAF